jgi:hypothetical protein
MNKRKTIRNAYRPTNKQSVLPILIIKSQAKTNEKWNKLRKVFLMIFHPILELGTLVCTSLALPLPILSYYLGCKHGVETR